MKKEIKKLQVGVDGFMKLKFLAELYLIAAERPAQNMADIK